MRENDMATTPEIRIDKQVFESFPRWSGYVPPGYWANWLGVLTSANVWAFSKEVLALFAKGRHEVPRYPLKEESILDWVPLLQAVLEAGDTFVMAALGAGWGRWLSAGAFAAKKLGRNYHLIGVEAEPEHFRWLQLHFQENHLDPAHCLLLNAAASAHSGDCWFYVGKPACWYGQCIVPDSTLNGIPNHAAIGDESDHNGEKIRRVQSVTIDDVLRGQRRVDYLHMDIQGAEYDFLSANPELLGATVKMVNIGTHSPEIEVQCRTLFEELGWRNRYDVPLNSKLPVYFGDEFVADVQFGDGVQVWINPRFSAGVASAAA
jgi:FkbM family methyltransferase